MMLSDCVCEQNTSTQPPSLFLFNQGANTALVEKSVQHVSATLPFKLLSAVGCDRHMERSLSFASHAGHESQRRPTGLQLFFGPSVFFQEPWCHSPITAETVIKKSLFIDSEYFK
ncbi:hypothetical protein F2P79_004582 [Pimephales promelas]|nr:hypothetical protein F2P79_004582 [Pimephales promelas]